MCQVHCFGFIVFLGVHYSDAIMGAMAFQITSLTIVYSTVYSDADQRKHQSSASLAFVREFTGDRWIPHTNGQLRGKCFHLMTSSCRGALGGLFHRSLSRTNVKGWRNMRRHLYSSQTCQLVMVWPKYSFTARDCLYIGVAARGGRRRQPLWFQALYPETLPHYGLINWYNRHYIVHSLTYIQQHTLQRKNNDIFFSRFGFNKRQLIHILVEYDIEFLYEPI